MNISKLQILSYHLFKLLTKGYSDKLLGISVDITNKCNLHCKHCYWWQQEHKQELTDSQWIKKIEKIKKDNPYIIQAFWLGGEPLLRAGLLEKLFPFFKLNNVITNGTISIPRWKNVNFSVSVDGIKKDYERIRGSGIYNKVEKNILKNKNLNLHITCTLNKVNIKSIDKFVKNWHNFGIKGITFTIYTEIKGGSNKLGFNINQRDKVIDKILDLKERYKDFIYGTKSEYLLMKSKNCLKATNWCKRHYTTMGICLNSQGREKKPCIFGNLANCNYCGCPLPYLMYAVKKRDVNTLYEVFKRDVFRR